MQNMRRRGNSLENSPIERVFRSLKIEGKQVKGDRELSYARCDIGQ